MVAGMKVIQIVPQIIMLAAMPCCRPRGGTIAATESGFSEEKSPEAWRTAIRKALEN